MKKILSIATFSLLLTCGLYSCADFEQIESGKINACEIKQVKELLKEDPTNKELLEKKKTFEGFLKTNRELSKDPKAFDEAIEEHLKSCR